jgi:hypothetical protein
VDSFANGIDDIKLGRADGGRNRKTPARGVGESYIHILDANTSARWHVGLTIRLISPTAHIHGRLTNSGSDCSTMSMEVVRGVNRNAGNDFAVGGGVRANAKRSGSLAIE